MYKRLLSDKTLAALDAMHRELGQALEGTTPDDDLDLVTGLLFARRARTILQLGTFLGYTALVLADIARQQSEQALVVTVDPNSKYNSNCRRYADLAGLGDYIQTFDGYSTMLSPSIASRNFDAIYLDTTHQYDQTVQELICLAPLLRPETVLLFHDASSHAQGLDVQGAGGVKRAIREWLQRHTEYQGAIFEQSGGFGKFGIGYIQKRGEA